MSKQKLPQISLDEIVAELERVELAVTGEGSTVEELSQRLGHSSRWVRIKLKELIGKGRMVCSGSKTTLRIDGKPTKIPLYKLVAQAPSTDTHKKKG